ncbi:ABC transporter substrate-binding protein [Paraburkholderia sp.]|uniref:ABC transporter substrate-binding protein n=1 Tax=Paraburkholderia sp. TaxID=1926495 RepID=UPI002389F0F0|nr:ABC transporter substrate-binding protein [Paraburkholderia sp.]MDE1180915.1 ABC transporter substrate-binding protein [Paraburkholderia sp.]
MLSLSTSSLLFKRRLARWTAALAATVAFACGAAFVSAPACAASAVPGATVAPAAAAPAATPDAATSIASFPTTATGLVKMPDGRMLTPEFARIAARGELVVAVLGVDQPPFFQEVNGKLTGIDIDIAKELAAKLGVKVRFNRDARSFDGVVTLLANGGADLAISKLSRTLSRAEVVSFSAPYIRLHRALLLNRVKFAELAHGRPAPDVVRNYDGTIGVVLNSSYASYVVSNFPHAKVVSFPSWDALLKGLSAGEVTAAYRDEFEVKHVLKVDPTASLRLRVITLEDLDDTISIGVNVCAPALLAYVNQFLAERTGKIDVMTLLQASND